MFDFPNLLPRTSLINPRGVLPNFSVRFQRLLCAATSGWEPLPEKMKEDEDNVFFIPLEDARKHPVWS